MRLPLSRAALRRHQAFLHRRPSERPLVGSWLYGFYVPQLYPRVAGALPLGPVQPEDIPVAAFLADIDDLVAAYQSLGDDYPFSAGALALVPWMEAIMGCPIQFSGTTMWADPCISDWRSYDWRIPASGERWRRKLLEMLAALVERGEGRFACSPTLMRGVADISAAMRTPGNLALDLYDTPDLVQRLAALCADALVEVATDQLDLLPASENGYLVGTSGLRCWFPGKGVWLQDDAVAVLSPRFYRSVFLPEVRRVLAHFAYVAFHLHGGSLWPLDIFMPLPEITVLELNYDVGGSELEGKLIPAWARIQQSKPCIAFAQVTLDQAGCIRQALSPTGLSFQTLAPTMAEALAVRDLFVGG